MGPVNKIMTVYWEYFLSTNFNMCFGCSKERSHWDGSFEYPQHMFCLRNEKIFFNYAVLSGRLYTSKNINLVNKYTEK